MNHQRKLCGRYIPLFGGSKLDRESDILDVYLNILAFESCGFTEWWGGGGFIHLNVVVSAQPVY